MRAAGRTGGSESGVALITVMFLFAIAATMAIAMLSRQRIEVERTSNLLDQTQAYYYALGAEELARQVLAADALSPPGVTYPLQGWGQLRDGVPIDHGSLVFSLEDVQARFNLNTLLGTDPAPLQRFQYLAAALGLPRELAPSVAAQVRATMLYQRPGPQPFRGMDNSTALRSTAGMTADAYAALLPFVTALPVAKSQLNVNTATAMVLKAYVTDRDQYSALKQALTRNAFVTEQQLRALGINAEGLGTESRYFRVTALAEVNGRSVRLTSVICRDVDIAGIVYVRVIRRDLDKVF